MDNPLLIRSYVCFTWKKWCKTLSIRCFVVNLGGLCSSKSNTDVVALADDDDDDDDDDAEVDSIGSDVESRRSSSVLEFVGIDCEEFSMSWPLSIS